jgi:hypothetical protein
MTVRPLSGVSITSGDGSQAHSRPGEPTLVSTWQGVTGSPVGDELLEWPPDVFALTDVILERAGTSTPRDRYPRAAAITGSGPAWPRR